MNSLVDVLTVRDALREGALRLTQAGVENADWEARELLAFALGAPPVMLSAAPRRPVEGPALAAWERLLAERCLRRPLAYVLGEWDFCGLRLEVTPDVLVPRPETEELFGWAAEELPAHLMSVADVGTGSGCLAVALAKRFPEANVWAYDASPAALAVAGRNARVHGVGRRVYCLRGDLLSRFPVSMALEAVVANLPYVDEKDMDGLQAEVKHEPAMALNGGPGGLVLVRRLLAQARDLLLPGGRIFLEVGHDQGAEAARKARDLGFRTDLKKDFAGIERFVRGIKTK